MKRTLLLLMLASLGGCQSPSTISPRTCGNPCSTNNDCTDFFSGCRVCFRGKCASSLPAQPISDAGIDATPDAP